MTATMPARTKPRLKERYDTQIRAQLMQQLGLANVMEVPRLEKIVVNMGVGKATGEKKFLEEAVEALKSL